MVDEKQHFGDQIEKLKKNCKSGNGWRRVFKIIPSMVSAGINCGLASPPHAADKPEDHMMRNLGPFLYECMS